MVFYFYRFQNAGFFSSFQYLNNGHISRPMPQVNSLLDNAQSNMVNVSRRIETDSQCPVCLSELHYPVETNCGHLFCGQYFSVN